MSTGVHPIQLRPENVENVAGIWITNDILLHAALYYARNDRPVFPCCPWDGAYLNYEGEPIDGKAPLTTHGWKDASTDLNLITKWWAQFEFAMIGSPVAPDELCLDFDPRHEGGDRWSLCEVAGITELPITRMVLSGRYDGGHHLFFQGPIGQLTDVRIPDGVDLRVGGRHYTILPPSVHPESGGAYLWRWDPDAPAAPLPAEVAELLVSAKRERTAFTPRDLGGPFGTPSASQLLNSRGSSGRPTAKALAGLLRTVAGTGEGKRQTIGFWAAGKLLEGGYPLAAWDALEDALRSTGASDHDVRTALRERPDGRVHA